MEQINIQIQIHQQKITELIDKQKNSNDINQIRTYNMEISKETEFIESLLKIKNNLNSNIIQTLQKDNSDNNKIKAQTNNKEENKNKNKKKKLKEKQNLNLDNKKLIFPKKKKNISMK